MKPPLPSDEPPDRELRTKKPTHEIRTPLVVISPKILQETNSDRGHSEKNIGLKSSESNEVKQNTENIISQTHVRIQPCTLEGRQNKKRARIMPRRFIHVYQDNG